MGRFFLGFCLPIVLVVLVVLGIWLCDVFGLLEVNRLALETVSILPGLENVVKEVELGKKRSQMLQNMESELRARENLLKKAEAKLAEEREDFETQKLQWEKQRLREEASGKSSNNPKNGAGKEVEIKKYLELIGGMKPAKAAAVIEKLPVETSLAILKEIRPSQATKIMENMSSDYVAALTEKRLKP